MVAEAKGDSLVGGQLPLLQPLQPLSAAVPVVPSNVALPPPPPPPPAPSTILGNAPPAPPPAPGGGPAPKAAPSKVSKDDIACEEIRQPLALHSAEVICKAMQQWLPAVRAIEPSKIRHDLAYVATLISDAAHQGDVSGCARAAANSRGDLMDQIRNGMALRKASERKMSAAAAPEMSAEVQGGLMDMLAQAVMVRRASFVPEMQQDEEHSDTGSDFSD
ncbi:hypothetical protein CYMTET_15679 [Cymbomonas tetramitiformis]|uniref:WH2 domain-containing protein n=1 Tax=Cymbomonas tetramitiformis TaxID=36881 RepID=A0AAE0GDR4_9CHLO|nr:hypothetical protein CYMTET_15679 [Cymbomonas tetramitiformis]